MTRHVPAPTVVVAVGLSDRSLAQVQWAAAEASARRADLRIVHVLPGSLALAPLALDGGATDAAVHAHGVAHELLQQATLAAWAVASDLDVTTDVVNGPVVRALHRHSRGAELLVIGEGGRPRSRRWTHWSTLRRLTATVTCPLAVVGATRLTVPSTGNESPGPSPYVVVSADVTTLGSALQLAFPAARRRCLPLDVVCVVTTDSPADMEGVCGSAEDAQEHASRWCQLAVEPWVARYPDVPVRLRIEQGDPASVLLSTTRGAALLVIGNRQHTLTGHSTGPTHRVLRKATCPSVVAPPLHLDVQPPQRRLFRFIDDPKASQAHQ